MPPRPLLLTCIGWLWILVGAVLAPLQIWLFKLKLVGTVVELLAIPMTLGALVIGPGMMVVGVMLLRRSRLARVVALVASGGMCLSALVAVGCVPVFAVLVHYQSGGDATSQDYLAVLGAVLVGLVGPPTWVLVLVADVVNSFPRAPVVRAPVPPMPNDERRYQN